MNMLIHFFLTLLLFELSECCGHSPFTFKYIDEEISDDLETFPWLVVIRDKADSVFKLGYGALIHPQVVITSALTVKELTTTSLLVETNCSIALTWAPQNCSERQVVKVLTFENNRTIDDYYEHNYIFLLLKYPLLVDTVGIADNVNNINPTNCYFLRWMREIIKNSRRKELVTVKYKTSFSAGHLNVSSFDKNQLWTDRDFIISRTFHYNQVTHRTKNQNFLNFMGSPLICQDKKNPAHYVLAGIGTFNLRINGPDNVLVAFFSGDSYEIAHEGSFINIINYCKQILQNIDLYIIPL